MKVAVVHYHLRKGGVTRVIESVRDALPTSRDVEVVVLSGEEPAPGQFEGEVVVVPGLSFRKTGNSTIAASLTDALCDAVKKHFGSLPDLWHFHNHTIGKNVLVPSVVRELAESGQKLLLHMHDFPEDGRPQNYAAQRSFFDSEKAFETTLYPRGSHVHYATVNQRDFGFLRDAGLDADNVHLLPNPVYGLSVETTPDDRPFDRDRLFAFYPGRGIRRKNLGELLLLSLLYRGEATFATSLSPEEADWQSIHEKWKGVAERLDLPVTFGIADDGNYSYPDVVGWSDVAISTSIAEGYGLPFLEPWLVGKSIVGRNISRITRDFAENGIDLSHLYNRLEVPVEWIDGDELRKAADSTLRQTCLAYDRVLPKNALEIAMKVWVQDGKVDFGVLNEPIQTAILEKLASDPKLASRLDPPAIRPLSTEGIATRKEMVEAHYSVESYGSRLMAVYDRAHASRASRLRHVNPRLLLDCFLDPRRLNLLRI